MFKFIGGLIIGIWLGAIIAAIAMLSKGGQNENI